MVSNVKADAQYQIIGLKVVQRMRRCILTSRRNAEWKNRKNFEILIFAYNKYLLSTSI